MHWFFWTVGDETRAVNLEHVLVVEFRRGGAAVRLVTKDEFTIEDADAVRRLREELELLIDA